MNRRILISLIAVAILAGGIGFAMWQSSSSERTSEELEQTENTVNYDPPTEEERQVGDEIKEEIEDQQNQRDGSQVGSQQKKVTVVISDAGQYDNVVEVRSFVHDHIQAGTCIYTFRKDGQQVSKEMPASPDASTTICNNPNIPRDDFPSGGDWRLVVSYRSSGATGQSAAQTVRLR